TRDPGDIILIIEKGPTLNVFLLQNTRGGYTRKVGASLSLPPFSRLRRQERRNASNTKSVALSSSHEPPHHHASKWERKNGDLHRLQRGCSCYFIPTREGRLLLSKQPKERRTSHVTGKCYPL